MTLSVIVPAYNAEKTLPGLLDSLSEQDFRDFEVIVVDDCSQDRTARIVNGYAPFNLVKLEENRGPAHCRNVGAGRAQGSVLVFTDSDCVVHRAWLSRINEFFSSVGSEALMGRLVLRPSNWLGDSISALGFPAGGSLGFDKVWRVDGDGITESLSSCNCAIRRDIFNAVGGFDETFPYAGGEDSFLAYSLRKAGYSISYRPDVLVHHEARDSLGGFLRWQFRRGISSYIFARKVEDRKGYMSLRIWSTRNVIKYNLRDKKIPLIVTLLLVSFMMQASGAFYSRFKGK